MKSRQLQLAVFFWLVLVLHASATVRYVNVNNSSPASPYNSWAKAATNIQTAIDAANSGDQILVTNGIYRVGNRAVSGMTNRVAVTKLLSVASVNGPVVTWVDGGGAVRCFNMVDGSSLSGFTLTNGMTSENGGGIRCDTTNVVITNCVLAGNLATNQGGGAYQGTLINCSLIGNSAGGGVTYGNPAGGGAGGSVLSHCLVASNFTFNRGMGGGLNNCIATRCIITNNIANLNNAGGAYVGTLNNCLLAYNDAGYAGGGAFGSTLNNCTVVANTAENGPGGGVDSCTVNNCIVYYNSFINSILYGWTPDQTNCAFSALNYSCTTPQPTNGTGNFTNPPFFVDPVNGDWHLQSNSPCINGGNNTYVSTTNDLDGNPRIIGPTVDIGAYEYQAPTIAITLQPLSQTLLAGQTAQFNVAAISPLALGDRWYLNGAPLAGGGRISGSTTTNLTITGLQPSDAGNYQVVVTNTANSVTSVVASLTVIAAPTFITPLTNQVTMVYSNVTLSITVTGAPAIYFQWRKNGTNLANGASISGVDGPGLTVSNPQLSDSGQYSVIVSNSWGTATNTETLTVVPVLSWGIAVTTPPASVTNVMAIASAGEILAADFAVRTDGSVVGWGSDFYGILDIPSNATNLMTVTAGSEQAIAVRPDGTVVSWGYGGTVVPDYVTNVVAAAVESYGGCVALRQDGSVVTWNGAPAPPASATNVIAIGAGFYSCLAVRQDGTIVGWGDNSSGEISPPASATNVIAVGGGAFGAYTYSMALRADGTAVGFGTAPGIPADATNLIAVAPGDSHWMGLKQDGTAFDYGLGGPSPTNCVAIAASGDGYHDTVLVQDPNLILPPRFIQQPLGAATQTNQTVILLSRAIGSSPMKSQWYFNSVPLAGQTNNWLLLPALQIGQGGNYQVVVTNNFGSITSATATVWIPPVVIAQPSATVVFGSNVSFSVTAAGTPPLSIQWYFNGAPMIDGGRISGSTTTNLTIANFQAADLGNFTVVVSNLTGSVTSAPATVSVLNPMISAQPQDRSVLGGATTTFSVSATGQQPFTYQWRFDGTNLDGATNNPLVLTNVLVSQTGTYSVVVSNIYGTAESSNAALTVTALTITTQPTNRGAWLNGSASFRVNVSGQSPLNFEWRCNGVDVPGLQTNLLTLTNLQAAQFGTYYVIVSNAYGSVISSNATLFLSQVAVWGNYYGETNLPPGLTNLIAISGGTVSTMDCLALKADGTTISWPASPSGFVAAEVTNLIAIACGGGNGPNLGLRPDGTVISWQFDTPRAVQGLTNIVAIASRNYSYLALKTNGTLVNLGLAGAAPPIVTNLINVVAIAEGYQHSIALTADGTVTAWGNNTYGQTNVPAGLSNVVAIAAGGYHTLALKGDGTIVAWGRNSEHQTNVPAGLSNMVAIAAGGYHSLALKSDGTVVSWGLNTDGQTNVPPNLTNVIAIAAGQYHSLALIGFGPPITRAPLSNPNLNANGFNLSLPTQSGKVYVLQFMNSLSDSNWTSLPLVPGNGSTTLLTDPTATNSQRFYRVQQW